eukprot:TRINITY_DN1711_c0_g1_i1.p1 TRINITY_DN1711_c0_g1~~TRINITY_DN1711_c0_g1_i1.p1  ORF type:complete len:293 (-),score=70.29 TRINITY_DN1711_c0_g1_i1:311-1189(-)
MVDRFADFKGGSTDHESVSIEMDHLNPDGEGNGGFMDTFFQDVGLIKNRMANVRRNLERLTVLQEKAVTATRQGDSTSEEIQDLMDATNGECVAIKSRLKEMEAQIKKAQGDSTAQERIRKNMYGTLSKQFIELMSLYQEKQSKYKSQIRDKTERQLKIVNPEITKEQVDRVVEEGANAQIFVDAMADKYSQVYNDVLDRHNEILKLESSIAELHQLFVDMSILVEAQGELLNQIEHCVSQSVTYTAKGVKELQKANDYAKSSRKKMCFLMVLFLVILIVILFPMLASQKML